MEGILSIFWLIGCSIVLPIIIIWLGTRKQINETNKRTEIIMSALEKNPDVNVAEWLDKLASENKGKLLKEKLMTKLTWGIICLILGIGTIVYGACSSFASSMPTFGMPTFGGALLAVGIALLVSFFIGKKFLAKEIEAESKKIIQQ